MRTHEGLTIAEALENFSVLAEMDSLDEIEITEDSKVISHKTDIEGTRQGKETYWLHARADSQTLIAIKESLKTIYKYLEMSYRHLKETREPQRTFQGINTIMIMVGETTKKLERFGDIFQKVIALEEYQNLLHFYREKMMKESLQEKEEFLDASVSFENAVELLPFTKMGEYPLDNLERVKNDTDYELFYLKNEDGRKFYSYELARNIKLACEFGEVEEYFTQDPLLQIKNWQDKSGQMLATRLLSIIKIPMEKFYKEAMKYKEIELVACMNKALMALMLSSYSKNLIRQSAPKGCHLYFKDFLRFFRESVQTNDFQRVLVYSPSSMHPFFPKVVDLIQRIASALFTIGEIPEEITAMLGGLRTDSLKDNLLSQFLQHKDTLLRELLKKHPQGPVFKALDVITGDEPKVFDPMMEDNLPLPECIFIKDSKPINLIHMPSPIIQEFINHAEINEEFKQFLKQLSIEKKKYLLINFQDRTSWKEHARCLALEELSRNAQFLDEFSLVTITKDTEFYHQSHHYYDLNNVKLFVDQFLSHIHDEASGYYYSPQLHKILFPEFSTHLVKIVHKIFFDGKNQLSRDERLSFIDIVYLFLELKIVEDSHPDIFTFSSKDGLDLGGTSSILFVALIGFLQDKKWSDLEKESLACILFAPTLLMRERAILEDRFYRTHHVLQILESKKKKLKDLLALVAPLFDSKTLAMDVHITHPPSKKK